MESLKAVLLESVEKEFDEFKNNMLTNTKEYIFDDYNIIYFYSEIRSFMNDCDLAEDKYETLIKESEYGLLDSLWGEYLSWDGVSVGSYDDAENFIDEFIEYSRENQGEM